MSILDRLNESVKETPGTEFIAEDSAFSDQFPGIHEFLSRVKYRGDDRKPGRLICYYEAGKASLCLSDQHTGMVAFHTASGLLEALEACEARLQNGGLDWRKSKKAQWNR